MQAAWETWMWDRGGKELGTECSRGRDAAGDSVRQDKTCRERVAFSHQILCVIAQGHTWRKSPPGSSSLPGPLEQSHGVTAGRTGTGSPSGTWVKHWAMTSNVRLPQPRSDTCTGPWAGHGPCDGMGRGVRLVPREGRRRGHC